MYLPNSSNSVLLSSIVTEQTFADCISGMAPALLEIIWNQSVDPASATGAVKPATFIVKLKETMKAGGWGHSLFETMIQDSREE